MASREVEEFAQMLVKWVRDMAIRDSDRIAQTAGGDGRAKRWREALQCGPDAYAEVIIPDVVDETIARLLIAIDQEVLRISFTGSNGKSVDLTTVAKASGELSGWYGGSGGWCEKYSKERTYDDFSDLNHFFDKRDGS